MLPLSIKLDDITCLDAAEVWIDPSVPDYVVLSGVSKMVSVEVFGQVQGDEQVIVDFSNLKSTLKALIDDPDGGFDHKLLINFEDFSKDNVEYETKGENGRKRDMLRIRKPDGTIAFQVKGDGFVRSYDGKFQDSISAHLTAGIRAIYGTKDLTAVATLHGQPSHVFDGAYRASFNYMHGLCNSSSYGCQNIIHGHSSYVQVINEFGGVDEYVTNFIAEYLDGCYLYSEEHLRWEDMAASNDSELYKIGYTSRNRGKWTLKIPGSYQMPLTNEPTIENIVKHVAWVFKDELAEAKAAKLIISEGLTKAGIVCLL